MRLNGSPELKATVRPDINRDKIILRFGALSYVCSRREAIDLANGILTAFDHLHEADVDRITGRTRSADK
ncbi:hypothetical protein QRB32_09445 [Mycobacterium intracellulare subsp. chimaera]|uniref:hypothetical protein n=1 Tax=Mycobacterium intracellulare TaxID=1767 RepID=UPI00259B7FE6|nr:hypothetical protein [Mycobacterium intracellulare]MDM3932423.1 hypothetical protein [Mycobacterium intracellulare subsp. chimaera]